MANSPEKPPEVALDEEAKQLKLAQVKAEARKAIAEADAGTAAAGVPAAQSKPMAGAVDVGEKGGSSLVAVVAAKALTAAAEKIAKRVGEKANGHPIIFVDDRAVAEGDAVYAEVTTRLEQFSHSIDTALQALKPPGSTRGRQALVGVAPLAAIVGLGSLLGDVLGLFRSDYKVAGREASINRVALVALVAGGLPEGVKAILPNFGLVKDSAVFASFSSLLERRDKLESAVLSSQYARVDGKQAEIDVLDAYLAEERTARATAVADGDQTKAQRINTEITETARALRELRGDLVFQGVRSQLASARAILASFDAYAKIVTAATEGGTTSPLVAAALRERARKGDKGGKQPHLLYLEVTASGGDAVTRTSVLWWGGKAAFLGAVQATYLLASADGELLASGAVTEAKASSYDFESLKLGSATWD